MLRLILDFSRRDTPPALRLFHDRSLGQQLALCWCRYLPPETSCLAGRCLEPCQQSLRCDQFPSLMQMEGQLLIAYVIKLEPNPASHAYVRRFVELIRRAFNQHRLDSRRRRHHDRDMPVVMMVVGKHRKYLFADEKGWFTVREFFSRLSKRSADSPYSQQMLLGRVALFRSAVRKSFSEAGSKSRATTRLRGPLNGLTPFFDNHSAIGLHGESLLDVSKHEAIVGRVRTAVSDRDVPSVGTRRPGRRQSALNR